MQLCVTAPPAAQLAPKALTRLLQEQAAKSLEALAVELAVEGVLREVPAQAQLAHYLGAPHFAKPAKLPGDLEPPASMAAVRMTAMVAGVLPLVAVAATRAQ